MDRPGFDRRTFLGGSFAGAAGVALGAFGGGALGLGSNGTVGAVTAAVSGTAPVNPFLARSVVPIGHNNSAQTSSVSVRGPKGPTRTLKDSQLQYQFLGPGHFGLAISSPYSNGSRVIWSNGADRISKLDYESLEVLAELPVSGVAQVTATQSEEAIATQDSVSGLQLAQTSVGLAAQYLRSVSGAYFSLDRTNTLFVSGTVSVTAYAETKPGQRRSPIEVRSEYLSAAVPGNFVGSNVTFDGKVLAVTNEGWVVALDHNLKELATLALPGADAAAAHNQAITKSGYNLSAGSWVRKSLSVDKDGGIYVASPGMLHRIVWTGTKLSSDPADGAWSEPYLDADNLGTGSTPSLMGFGSGDQFVVITDGQPVMNIVLYWRGKIPANWEPPPGAPSKRIAGMLPVNLGDPNIARVVTQQAVVTNGYGAFTVNNLPATIPASVPLIAQQALTAYSGADPDFAPHGVQKFQWDPRTRRLRSAWANTEVSDPNSVPIVSTTSNTVYFIGARDGKWTVEGLNWATGRSRFTWIAGSNRYNSLFSGTELDQEGRIIYTTEFGIVRCTV